MGLEYPEIPIKKGDNLWVDFPLLTDGYTEYTQIWARARVIHELPRLWMAVMRVFGV